MIVMFDFRIFVFILVLENLFMWCYECIEDWVVEFGWGIIKGFIFRYIVVGYELVMCVEKWDRGWMR